MVELNERLAKAVGWEYFSRCGWIAPHRILSPQLGQKMDFDLPDIFSELDSSLDRIKPSIKGLERIVFKYDPGKVKCQIYARHFLIATDHEGISDNENDAFCLAADKYFSEVGK